MPEILIDDTNFMQFTQPIVLDGERKGRGLAPRDFKAMPHGSSPSAGAFNLPIIPRSEWSARIKAMETDQSRLSDVVRAIGMPSLNQGQTNYCWANAPVNCVRVLLAVASEPFVDLSPASVGAPITGFQDEAGFGLKALEFIASNGVASASLWPPNAIDESFDTPDNRADAATRKITQWFDLEPRNFDQVATCLLNGIPVAVGYNWWSHEVTAMDLVEISPGGFGIRIWNSWGESFGDHGMAVLSESQGTPDDACAPNVVMV